MGVTIDKKRIQKPIIDDFFVLKKIQQKGGWTYAEMPPSLNLEKLKQNEHPAYFGWMRVKGSIDEYTFEKYNLMPLGNGNLFLPLKLSVRKLIKKEEGDSVHIVLYHDPISNEQSDEMKAALDIHPSYKEVFYKWEASRQVYYNLALNKAKTENDKLKVLEQLWKELER